MTKPYVTVTAVEGLDTSSPFLRLSYGERSFCLFVREDAARAGEVSFSPDYVSLPVRVTLGLPYFAKAVLKALREYPAPSFELVSLPRAQKSIDAVGGTYYADGGRNTFPVAVSPALWLSLIHTGAHIGDLVVRWDGDAEPTTFAKWRVRTTSGAYCLYAGAGGESPVLIEEGFSSAPPAPGTLSSQMTGG
jgi:hypothetical protein